MQISTIAQLKKRKPIPGPGAIKQSISLPKQSTKKNKGYKVKYKAIPVSVNDYCIKAQIAVNARKPWHAILELDGIEAVKEALTLLPQKIVDVDAIIMAHILSSSMPARMIKIFLEQFTTQNEMNMSDFYKKKFWLDNIDYLQASRNFTRLRKIPSPASRDRISGGKNPEEYVGLRPKRLPSSKQHARLLLEPEKIVGLMKTAPWLPNMVVTATILDKNSPNALPNIATISNKNSLNDGGLANRQWYLDNWITIRPYYGVEPVKFQLSDGSIITETPEMHDQYVNYLQEFFAVPSDISPPPNPQAMQKLIEVYVRSCPEYLKTLGAGLDTELSNVEYEEKGLRALAYAIPAFGGQFPLVHIKRLAEGRYKPKGFFNLISDQVYAEIFTEPTLTHALESRLKLLINSRIAELKIEYRRLAAGDLTSKSQRTHALLTRLPHKNLEKITQSQLNTLIRDYRTDMNLRKNSKTLAVNQRLAPEDVITWEGPNLGDYLITAFSGYRGIRKAQIWNNAPAVVLDLLATLQEPVCNQPNAATNIQDNITAIIIEEKDYTPKRSKNRKPQAIDQTELLSILMAYLDKRANK